MQVKYLIPLIFFCFSLSAQVNLTEDDIQSSGSSMTYYMIQPDVPLYENVSGSGVVWDYNTVVSAEETKVAQVLDPSDTPYSADFSSSTDYYEISGIIGMYYSLASDQMKTQGFLYKDVIIPVLGTSDIRLVIAGSGIEMMDFPAGVSSSPVSENYNAELKIPGTPNFPATGVSYVDIDGEGQLKLAGQDFNDVVRVRTIDTAFCSIEILFTIFNIEIRRQQFEYRNSSSTFPLFSVTKVEIIDVDSDSKMAEFDAVLSSLEPGTLSTDTETYKNTVSFYPNPFREKVNLRISSSKSGAGTYKVYNSIGKQVAEKNISVDKGIQDVSIDLRDVPSGIYFVKIAVNGETLTKKISKM